MQLNLSYCHSRDKKPPNGGDVSLRQLRQFNEVPAVTISINLYTVVVRQ